MTATTESNVRIEYPYLIPRNDGDTLTSATKNIRIELKRAFPGVKFSVTSSRFSGGDSISIRWTDGPTDKEVSKITDKYSAGSFDGMTDCYNYSHDPFTAMFGDAKYVNTNRCHSDEAIAQAIAELQQKYPGNDIKGTVEDFKQGRLYNVHPFGSNGCHSNSLQHLIFARMEKRDED